MTRDLICIICPLGCRMRIELKDGQFESVSGNTCPRGSAYAKNEITAPERILTTTVRVKGGTAHLVSVKSAQPLPKSLLFECMKAINSVLIDAPVAIGDIVVRNILKTGIDIVATCDIKKR